MDSQYSWAPPQRIRVLIWLRFSSPLLRCNTLRRLLNVTERYAVEFRTVLETDLIVKRRGMVDARVRRHRIRGLRRPHPIMTDAPFTAVGVAEQACGGEEEPAPAPHPQVRVVAVDIAKHGFDLVAVTVEIAKPVERGALVMRAAPAPFLLDLEQILILPDQVVARHHPAGEEMLGDP